MPLAVRAVLAIAMMVLFYAFAAAGTAGLVWLGIKLFGALAEIHGRGVIVIGLLAIVCLISAGVIVWSVVPRFDRFEPPGTEVTEREHPELFVEIRRIAAATGQRVPTHVYLVPDVNAFVAQRGGIMGVGSRRVMGIGLPLLRTLQVDELRAVLAHEMGHFYGGDTRLGPWIYKTRGALARTVVNLARARSKSTESQTAMIVFAAVQAPFRWFLLGYLRVSQAISRAQEYSADAVAVRAEGHRALVDGLKKTHAAALAYSLYMRNEVLPLMHHGALPDVGEGFSRYLASATMTKLLDEAVNHELAEGVHDPYDSHPPLRERIAAAGAVAGAEPVPDTRPAIALVRDADTIEIADLLGRVTRPLERIRWADTPQLWTKAWRAETEEVREVLAGLRVDTFPTALARIYELATQVLGRELVDTGTDDDVRNWWQHVVGTALAVVLIDAGFTAATAPGEPFRFTRDDVTVEPFAEVARRLAGEVSTEAWTTRWRELGLEGRALA